jgi:hypothetical protein
MDIPDFIQKVLIDEFKEIQHGEWHPCLSSALLGQAIEFLGACLDSEPFSAKGLSAPRFRKAIYDLFPPSYHRFNQGTGKPFDLYDNLRPGLLLPILPGIRLELLRRIDREKWRAHHLDVVEIRGLSRLVLVWEDLLEDYERACHEVMARIRDGRLKGWKFDGD